MASLNPIAGTLGEKNAAHLLRRATWGPSPTDIRTFAALTPAEALNTLLSPQSVPLPPVDLKTGMTWVNPPDHPAAVEEVNSTQETLFGFFKAWHMEQMRLS